MDKEQGMILANLRLDRSRELLAESKDLLKKVLINRQTTEHFMQSKKVLKHCSPQNKWR